MVIIYLQRVGRLEDGDRVGYLVGGNWVMWFFMIKDKRSEWKCGKSEGRS